MGLSIQSEPEEKAMTLDEILLQKLAKWRPDSTRQPLEVSDPNSGWTVRLDAECVEQVGSRLNELSLGRTTPLEGVDLKARAEKIAGRTTGLLEQLRLVEADGQAGSALLRSSAPSKRGDSVQYYELLLNQGGSGSLKRYEASQEPGTRRHSVPFALTHEALAKLVGDLTAS
jgi:hypothetical protein